MATAVGNREFSLWVGSGISLGRAPGLSDLISLVIDYLQERSDPIQPACRFRRALFDVLRLAALDDDAIEALPLNSPFSSWSERDSITSALRQRYSELLDVRVDGERDDFLLWEAADVRSTYGSLSSPDAEHLCIALLLLEGAFETIPCANWDGLIEAAVRDLSGSDNSLQVIVDPERLRDPPAQARLVKFHGCAVLARDDPTTFRKFLVGSQSQITFWPHNPQFAAVRDDLRNVATSFRTLMMGLSLQDTNLQDLFAASRATLPWTWPCDPAAPGHIFFERSLGAKQKNMLKVSYGENFGEHRSDIEQAALFPAFARESLLALVLHVTCQKLEALCDIALDTRASMADGTRQGLRFLRNQLASGAETDALQFINLYIAAWASIGSDFRERASNRLGRYEPISPLAVKSLADDANVARSGIGEAAIAVGQLGLGASSGAWSLSVRSSDGRIQAQATRPNAPPVTIFFVSDASAAIRLIASGTVESETSVVIHSDDAWAKLHPSRRAPTSAPGRTGQIEIRHVSMRELITASSNENDLSRRFAEEVTL